VIGGKILSGRTKDQNIAYIAEYLTGTSNNGRFRRPIERKFGLGPVLD
jgi:hypothetical protein